MYFSGALTLTVANIVARRNKPEHRGGSVALSALAALGVLISGWFGGRMVYEQGMRVRGVSPVEYAPDRKLPGDEHIERQLLATEKIVPATGPTVH